MGDEEVEVEVAAEADAGNPSPCEGEVVVPVVGGLHQAGSGATMAIGKAIVVRLEIGFEEAARLLQTAAVALCTG